MNSASPSEIRLTASEICFAREIRCASEIPFGSCKMRFISPEPKDFRFAVSARKQYDPL